MTYMAHDIGALLTVKSALDNTSVTAGGSGDNVEVNGDSIDRSALGNSNRQEYLSAKVAVRFDANLGGGETITLTANLQDSDDGSTWTDYADKDGNTTFSVTSSSANGVLQSDYDLSGAKRYIRVQVTPNLSAATTDTANVDAVIVLGGVDTPPAV